MEHVSTMDVEPDIRNAIKAPPSLQVQSNSPVKCFFILLLAAILSTLLALIVRIYPWLPPIEFNFLSCTTVLFASVPLWITFTRFDDDSRKALSGSKLILTWLLKDTVGTMSAIFLSLAIKKVSPSIVYIISSSSPFISAIFGRIFSKEPLTSVKLVGITFTVAGMVLTTFDNTGDAGFSISTGSQMIGSIYAIASALCSGALFILWKKIRMIHGTSLLMSSSINGVVISFVMSLVIEGYVVPPCGSAAWVLTLCGLANIATGLLLHLACRYGEGGVISALMTGLCVILAFVWQLLFFRHRPGTLEWVAGLLVIVGTSFNGSGTFLNKFKIFNFTI